VLVGFLNTAVGYFVYAALVLLGLHYSLAATLATIAGVIFNFNTSGRIVFRNSQWTRIGRFALVYGMILGLHITLLWLLKNKMGLRPLIGGALCLPVCVVVAYVLQKFFVFPKKGLKHG